MSDQNLWELAVKICDKKLKETFKSPEFEIVSETNWSHKTYEIDEIEDTMHSNIMMLSFWQQLKDQKDPPRGSGFVPLEGEQNESR